MQDNLILVRQLLEEREETLSPFASKSKFSKGRLSPLPPSMLRLEFQRDRDRIIHCNSFRRLKHKTQVFVAPVGDHYVTRLTHTLEVSQIARTISRALNLNEDLSEAVSLGHDLGHTPFGHIGEEVLNELYPAGFHHAEQSLRVVDHLENNGQGLNLTWEVRDGILNHSKSKTNEIMGSTWTRSGTLEGEICKFADAVAYINHDIDDAVRAGVIDEKDLPGPAIAVLGASRSERIDRMVSDIVLNSWAARGEDTSITPEIRMSESVRKATQELYLFLNETVYAGSSAGAEAVNAKRIVRALYRFFTQHPDRLPVEYTNLSQNKEQGVVDYIAGMTDGYAQSISLKLGL